MRQELLYVLKHNQEVNQYVLSLLKKLSAEEKSQDRGAHYKSLNGLFEHVLDATVFCTNYIGTLISTTILKTYNVEGLSLEEKITLLAEVDESLIRFAAEEVGLDRIFDFFDKKLSVAGIIYAIITHNAHHRGQMSQILDEMKIPHDLTTLITPA